MSSVKVTTRRHGNYGMVVNRDATEPTGSYSDKFPMKKVTFYVQE